MNHTTARMGCASALALALGLGCAVSGAAQTTRDGSATTGLRSTTVAPGAPGALGTMTDRTGITTGTALTDAERTTPHDRDHDWGWMGLLGLIGLAGLRGNHDARDVRDVRDVDRDRGRTTPTTR